MGLDRGAHQAVSGVGHERHSRIGDQCSRSALLEAHHQFAGALHFVVLVVTDGRRADVIVLQQLLRLPRVFAGNPRDFLEDTHGPERNVFQIADGGCHYEKSRGHSASIIDRGN